jgi:hypothetical protein
MTHLEIRKVGGAKGPYDVGEKVQFKAVLLDDGGKDVSDQDGLVGPTWILENAKGQVLEMQQGREVSLELVEQGSLTLKAVAKGCPEEALPITVGLKPAVSGFPPAPATGPAATPATGPAPGVAPAGSPGADPLVVSMKRGKKELTNDVSFWALLRSYTDGLSFNLYKRAMDSMFGCSIGSDPSFLPESRRPGAYLPISHFLPGTDVYEFLKSATDAYLAINSGVLPPSVTHEVTGGASDLEGRFVKIAHSPTDLRIPRDGESDRWAHRLDETRTLTGAELIARFKEYASDFFPDGKQNVASPELEERVLPYLALIKRNQLDGVGIQKAKDGSCLKDWIRIVYERLTNPCMIELIWSYWHEEGMLAQSMNAIGQRFQNKSAFGDREPLAQLEIDPLRPLNRILWGYVDDERNRLSVLRRAHEYEHQYGLTLQGKAVEGIKTVDRRSKFLESFHNLLYRCVEFFRQDDDATIVADAFPVLNAIKETHYVLAHGAHNQFGDLAWQARREMLLEQWILSRPEMREFIGGRVMVPYPEAWMDRVDSVKTLQGWTDGSVVHFHDLAVFGEKLLLGIRYGGWSQINEPDFAAVWARYWRAEIQGYIHGYRSVTGVDLSADITDQRELTARYIPPSVHLRARLNAQTSAGQLMGGERSRAMAMMTAARAGNVPSQK